MGILSRCLHIIDMISEWTGRIFAVFLPILGLVVFYEVVSRYVFDSPTSWAHDISSFLLIAMSMGGFAYTLRHKGHVNMEIFYIRLPRRVQAILDIISFPLLFVFCGVLAWKGIDFAWTAIQNLEVTTSPFRAPVYLVKPLVPIGAFLALLQGLAALARSFIVAITGKETTV